MAGSESTVLSCSGCRVVGRETGVVAVSGTVMGFASVFADSRLVRKSTGCLDAGNAMGTVSGTVFVFDFRFRGRCCCLGKRQSESVVADGATQLGCCRCSGQSACQGAKGLSC